MDCRVEYLESIPQTVASSVRRKGGSPIWEPTWQRERPGLFQHATTRSPHTFRTLVTRLLASYLLALLLFQSVGLPLQRHWCGGRIAEVGLLGDGHACCASANTLASGTAVTTQRNHNAEALDHVGGAQTDECCFDELRWEVRNAAASNEISELSAAPAPALPTLPELPLRLAGSELAVDRPRGSPPAADPRVSPRSQARAYLQVYLI